MIIVIYLEVKRQREKIQKERKEDKTESKDLTEGMETWQVYEIMVKNQMIQKYYPILMKELEGEYSFKNHELRRKFGDDPPPSLGDLYQVILYNQHVSMFSVKYILLD